MVRDYSGRYSGVVQNRQRVVGRRPGGSDKSRVWKIIAIVTTVAMVAGIACSVWFGLALRVSLDELAKSKLVKKELLSKNTMLQEQRQRLLTKESIEEAAKDVGLFPPGKKQIRRP